MIKIAPGIRGIKVILNRNSTGWHVTNEDDYLGFFALSLSELRVKLAESGYAEYRITWIGGNTLSIERIA